MRTVWLALLCLIGLATIVAVRIGMAPVASASASVGGAVTKAEVLRQATLPDGEALSSETLTAATELHNDALAKADKLEVLHTNDVAPEVKSIASIAIALPTTEPKPVSKKMDRIIIRHWHDPYDKQSTAARPKRKLSNTNTSRSSAGTLQTPKS
jgi:Flp pilus assembly protein CpaB